MVSARDQHVRDTLMQDPAFREAWAGVLAVCHRIDFNNLDDPDPIAQEIRQAMERAKAAIRARADLTALVEAAESDEH